MSRSRAFNAGTFSSSFTCGLLLIFCARSPKRSVLSVSCALNDDGEQLITSVVRELPPRQFCSSRVSFESR